MSMPWRSAVFSSVSPAYASAARPFSVIGIVSGLRTALMFGGSDLVREVLHDAAHRVRRRLAEAADRGVGHRQRQLFDQALIPLVHPDKPCRLFRADPAWRAFA